MYEGNAMIGNRRTLARLQSDFYRDSYYRMLRWLFISLSIILLLISLIIYYMLFTSPLHYYATTTTGQIIPMAPKY